MSKKFPNYQNIGFEILENRQILAIRATSHPYFTISA